MTFKTCSSVILTIEWCDEDVTSGGADRGVVESKPTNKLEAVRGITVAPKRQKLLGQS